MLFCPFHVDEKHILQYDVADVTEDDKSGTQIRCEASSNTLSEFEFDEVLVWVSQKTAFERIGLPVINNALKGINGAIIAYGQTGAGS